MVRVKFLEVRTDNFQVEDICKSVHYVKHRNTSLNCVIIHLQYVTSSCYKLNISSKVSSLLSPESLVTAIPIIKFILCVTQYL
jgi:hypothetical protein